MFSQVGPQAWAAEAVPNNIAAVMAATVIMFLIMFRFVGDEAVGFGDSTGRNTALDVVDVHEQSHLLAPRGWALRGGRPGPRRFARPPRPMLLRGGEPLS
jgi:hypothetical protein